MNRSYAGHINCYVAAIMTTECLKSPSTMKSFLSVALFLLTAAAQNITTDISDFIEIKEYPNEQWGNVSTLLDEGLEIAQQDMWPHFAHRCIRSQKYPELVEGNQPDMFVAPTSPFRDLYFVGQAHWSAWAIDTGNRELVLIDTLATPIEVDTILLPGLEKLGYSGSDIKHVIITHEHTDHFGGLATLQKRFNPIVYTSKTAWVAMANSTFDPVLYYNYTNAREVDDGQTITINKLSMRAYHTPGHTPGTISLMFPVVDNSTQKSYMAGFYGGGGIPSQPAAMVQQVTSFNRWSKLAKESKVEVLISNHQTQDNSLFNFDLLSHRDCQGKKCNIANPFVVGVDAYSRYSKLMGLCVRLQAARNGVNLAAAKDLGKRDVTTEKCHN